METACFLLSCWVKPVDIGVVGKIFHPNEDVPVRKQLDLWLPEEFCTVQELVTILWQMRVVAVKSAIKTFTSWG